MSRTAPDDGDEDGVEEATGAGVAKHEHDVAAENGPDDADDDVDDGAKPAPRMMRPVR